MADGTTPAPEPGPLSNAPGDGWLSGAAKGAGTAAVKAVGNVAGFVGGLSGLEDYLLAKGQSVVTGQTVDQAMADLAARRAKTEADMSQSPLGRLASASDPTKVLPSPADVSGPILARTGQYVPTSEVGRLAQAGTEAALSSVGPGMGAVSPGTAARALTVNLARQAPAMAAAGAASQGAVDATGSPLAGLIAGVATPCHRRSRSALLSGARAGSLAPVAGGSSLLNAAPRSSGPRFRLGVKPLWRSKLVGQSSDPANASRLGGEPGGRSGGTKLAPHVGGLGRERCRPVSGGEGRSERQQCDPDGERHGGRAVLRRAVLQRHRPGAVRCPGRGLAGWSARRPTCSGPDR